MNKFVIAALLIALMALPVAPLSTTTNAQIPLITEPNFEVLTNTTTPGGYVVFILSINWLRNTQGITDPYVYIYIEEPITGKRIPLLAEAAEAIYNRTGGGVPAPGGIGALPVGGILQDYVIVMAQLPAMDWWFNTIDPETGLPFADIFFNKELYLVVRGRNTGKEAYSTTKFYITAGTKNLEPRLNITDGYHFTYTGYTLLGGILTNNTVVADVYVWDYDANARFNYTDFVNEIRALDPTVTVKLTLEARWTDACGNNLLLVKAGFTNLTQDPTVPESDVLSSPPTMFYAENTTLEVNSTLTDFSVFYCNTMNVMGVDFSYANLSQVVSLDLRYFSLINASNASRFFFLDVTADELNVTIPPKNIKYVVPLSNYSIVGIGHAVQPTGNTLYLYYYDMSDDEPTTGNTGTDLLYNITRDARFDDVAFRIPSTWVYPDNVFIYPVTEFSKAADYSQPTPLFSYDEVFNVYDNVTFTVHHLTYGQNVTAIEVYTVVGGSLFYLGSIPVNVSITTDGLATFTVNLSSLPYDGRAVYFVPVTNESVRAWVGSTSAVNVYPLIDIVWLVQYNGAFQVDYDAALADYAIIRIVGVNASDVARVAYEFFYTNDTVNGSILLRPILERRNETNATILALVRVPYTGYQAGFLDYVNTTTKEFNATFVFVTDSGYEAYSKNVTVHLDGSEAKIFYVADPAVGKSFGYVHWWLIETTPKTDPSTVKYPYEAFETLVYNVPAEGNFTFYVEIIGVEYSKLTVTVHVYVGTELINLSDPASYAETVETQYNVTGYLRAVLKVPLLPYGSYTISVGEVTPGDDTPSVYASTPTELTYLNITSIIGIYVNKVSPTELTVPTASPAGDAWVTPDAIVYVRGWGFGKSEPVDIRLPDYAFNLVTSNVTDSYGRFWASFAVSYVQSLTGIDYGLVRFLVNDSAPAWYFTILIQELPRAVLQLDVDDNVMPAEMGSIAVRALLQYSTRQVPLNPLDLPVIVSFDRIVLKLKTISGGSVTVFDTITLTTTDFSDVVTTGLLKGVYPAHFDTETGLLVFYYTFSIPSHSAVVDAFLNATFGGAFGLSAYAVDTVSIDNVLEGKLDDIKNDLGTIIATLETKLGEIQVNLTALKSLVENGFADVKIQLSSVNATILAELAAVQAALSGEIGSAKAELEAYIDSTGALVIDTVVGQIWAAFDALSTIISESTTAILTAVDRSSAAIVATLQGDLDNAVGSVLAALNAGIENVTLKIDLAGADIMAYVNSTVWSAAEAVASDVYMMLFGGSQTVFLGEVEVSVADLIENAKNVVVEKVDEGTAAIVAEVGDTRVYLKGEIDSAVAAITSAAQSVAEQMSAKIDSSVDTIVDEIDSARSDLVSEIQGSTDTIRGAISSSKDAITSKIDSSTSTIETRISDAVSTLSDKIDAAKSDLSSSVDEVSSKVDEVSSALEETSATAGASKNFSTAAAILAALAMIFALVSMIRLLRAGPYFAGE